MQETLRVVVPIVVAHVCVLAAIVFLIKRLLLSDTMNAVSRIRQVEAEVRKKEEGIRKEIDDHEKELRQKKAEAEDALQKRKEEMEKEIGRTREQMLADAKSEGERILSSARKNEEQMKQKMRMNVSEEAVKYGGEVFKLVFSEKMTAQLDQQLVDELLDALNEIDAGSITVEAGEGAVTVCRPMMVDQKQRLEKLLHDKFGSDVKLKESVQEDLLGGLVLKLGSLEIDGSLLNRYREALAEVTREAHVAA